MSTMWRETRSVPRGLAALVAIVLLSLIGPIVASHGASAQDPAAVKAAQEIQAARDRADAAAQAMFDAESELDTLDIQIVESEKQLAAVEAQADSMRSNLQADAQRSFANSGSAIPLLVDLDEANATITADRQASVARGAATVELDDFDTVMKEVKQQRADLERQKEVTAQAREQYESLKKSAEAEVVKLAEIEKQRLADVAVQRELERQRKIRADQAAADAAAAAAAAAASQAAANSQRSAAMTSSASTSASSSGNGSSGGAAAAPQGAAAPAPVPESPPPSNAGSGMACPIAGPRAFGDTWGASRSGGRSHEGVDMMSPAGTPLVAVESGSVQFKTTRLGGNSVWLNGASGTRYFYAHLSAWEGSSRSVSQGEVIGYVGATGNTTANHLHFEVHPGGGRAVNPYPYVRAAC
jgi:murein DD-endopeptidase MepM/ murein hydrolase activator NlpD